MLASRKVSLVESLEIRRLLTVYVVTTAADSGGGSLRDAIVQANSNAGADQIVFNIGGGGSAQVIALASALPALTGVVTLDATTQGAAVELDGAAAGAAANGLVLGVEAGGSVVTGLTVKRFGQSGIRVTGAGNEIRGNVLAANRLDGVLVTGAGASNNVIVGNLIGVDGTGTVAEPNGQMGVHIADAGTGNRVGGPAVADRNVVGASVAEGIQVLRSNAAVIQGNFVGTDVSGTVALGNNIGIFLRNANNCVVGGTAPGEGNLSSGNRLHGISLLGAVGNVVEGNLVGTAAGGVGALGNLGIGINVSTGSTANLVGGTSAAERNVICNNVGGVNLSGSGNTVQGNWIGVDAGGNAAGNASRGINISSSGNLIGGTAAGAGNVIAYSAGAGVVVGAAGTGNAIRRNAIFSNGGLGIDLLPVAGPNANDPLDGDVGGNQLQNHPVITSVTTAAGVTTIQGTLHSAPGSSFTVELFRNQGASPFGTGEGETFIADTVVTTDAAGNATFTVSVAAIPAGDVVTATATDGGGNTSEFTNRAPVAVDDGYSVEEDGVLAGVDANGTATADPNDDGVVANDSDPDGNPVVAILDSGPSNGTLVFNADGTFVYTPNEDFAGTDTFTYHVSDGAAESDVATVTITVVGSTPGAAVIPDPCGEGEAVLVNGTGGDDFVLVTPVGNTGAYEIALNGASLGVFSAERIIVRAEEGNDNVQVAAAVDVPAWLFGESGNDRLFAGNNPGVLVGGSGDDQLTGGAGRDLLIGGQGSDRLGGTAGDDILIAGYTDHDNDYVALCHIMEQWTRTDLSFLDRVAVLGASLNPITVHDDDSADMNDVLNGASGDDWFFYRPDEDRANGVSAGEAAQVVVI